MLRRDQSLRNALRPEFIRSSLNLAAKTISNWGKWEEQENFPVNGSWEDKLLYVDNVLKLALGPMQHRPNERMFWRTRPDLNKYRGWLLNRVLQHQFTEQENRGSGQLILPEDLPKLADDLYAFHKHHRTIGRRKKPEAGTIQYYKTLEALSKSVTSYAPTFPFSQEDKIRAHDRFLEEHGGNGEARRIAALNDGTELVMVLSEDASRAYGTPRWCTAYRNQDTYFSDYKDDLFVIIDPDGQRWQLHFRSGQCHDENDRQINLADFLEAREGLDEALAPYWESAFRKKMHDVSADNIMFRDIRHEFDMGLSIPLFKKRALWGGGTNEDSIFQGCFKRLRKNIDRRDIDFITHLLKQTRDDSDFQELFAMDSLFKPLIPYWERYIKAAIDEIKSGNPRYFYADDIIDALKLAHNIPAFDTHLKDGFLEEVIQTLEFSGESTNDLNILVSIAKLFESDQDAREIIESVLLWEAYSCAHQTVPEDSSQLPTSYVSYYRLVMSDPEWREQAIAKGISEQAYERIDKAFDSFDPKTGKSESEDPNNYVGFCMFVSRVPEWRDHAEQKGYFKHVIDAGFLDHAFDEYEKDAKDNKIFGYTAKGLVTGFWPGVLAIPEWKEYAHAHNKLGRFIDALFASQPEKKSLGRFFSQDKNDPTKVLMFMLPLFRNRPEFRACFAPYIDSALYRSAGDTYYFKRSRGRIIPSVEILKHAKGCREWRTNISNDNIQRAFDKGSERDVPALLEVVKGRLTGEWQQAAISSGAVEKMLTSTDEYTVNQVKRAIEGHEPYESAFGAHL